MPLELVTVPCLKDNYAFLLHDAESGATALVDAPETGPILAVLSARKWSLSEIWLTHHHWDHIDGTAELVAATGARVTGASADAHRLPPLDRAVAEGESFTFAGEEVRVLDVSGHTLGHIALHLPAAGLVFTADSLMAMGCGRLFEGSPDVMWQSLTKLMALPPETQVCSGHEYTESNLRFALTLDPDNPALIFRAGTIAKARAEGGATVPSTLSDELATNPFLRARDPAFKSALGLAGASDAGVFAEIRARKDKF